MRTSDLLGRTAYDVAGRSLGKVTDLLTSTAPDGSQYVHSVLVTPRHRGRLFGYERPGFHGPWLIEKIARILHRGSREVPWSEITLEPPRS